MRSMDSLSTSLWSTSRTLSDLNPEKRHVDDEEGFAFDLSHLDLSEQDQFSTHSFNFLNKVEEPNPTSANMSPRTELHRNNVMMKTNERGRGLFGSDIIFNHSSIFST